MVIVMITRGKLSSVMAFSVHTAITWQSGRTEQDGTYSTANNKYFRVAGTLLVKTRTLIILQKENVIKPQGVRSKRRRVPSRGCQPSKIKIVFFTPKKEKLIFLPPFQCLNENSVNQILPLSSTLQHL